MTGKSPATDITHQIKAGDNFISPAVKEPTAISSLLSALTLGVDYADVRRLNSESGSFESYASGQFTQFEPGKGYNIIGLQPSAFSYGKTETTTTFVYDSTGSRVKKITPNSTSIYLGKDYDVVYSNAPAGGAGGGTGSLTSKYIFLGDRRISTKDSSGTLLFTHEDHISSSNVITDAQGNQAALLEYDPYGSTVTHTGTADPKHKFTGQESDDSTHLYYYGARYYDPVLGRFITPDWIVQSPSDPQSLNRYAYARNNPIVYTDPTGNWIFVAAIIGAIIGAVASGMQSGWDPKAMLVGAGIGALAGTVGGYAGGLAGGGIPGSIIGGAVGGAVAGGLNSAYYGGDVGQGILRGAGYGAAGGFLFGGIDAGFDKIASQPGFRWELVRAAQVAATGAAGGGLSQLSGGEFWEGVAFSSAIAGSKFLFELSTQLSSGKAIEPTLEGSKGGYQARDAGSQPPTDGTNVFGFSLTSEEVAKYESWPWYKKLLYEPSGLMQSISRWAPSAHGTSVGHDSWRGAWQKAGYTRGTDQFLNYATIAPAITLNTLGGASDPSMMGLFEVYDREKNR